MIGVEWELNSFRAWRIAADGGVRDSRAGLRGIARVQNGRFADTLRDEIGPWLAAGESQVVLAGAVGGQDGWVAAPYVACPAGPAEIAAALVDVPFHWAQVKLLPGLAAMDEGGVPEVMRGEEAQLIGILPDIGDRGFVCLPGRHSKWARIEQGRIDGFATWMTGDVQAALRAPTALGRMMRDAPTDLQAFDQGLARSADPGGLLHHIFGVRALGVAGRLSEGAAPSYLAGLLIGHEVREAVPRGAVVHLIGPPDLTQLYGRVVVACRSRPVVGRSDAAARGLFQIGGLAVWR